MGKRSKGISFVILAAFFWGVGGFFSKIGVTSVGPWSSALIRSLFFFPLVVGYVASRKDLDMNLDRDIVFPIGAGFSVAVGIIFARLSLSIYDVSLVKPIQRLSILVTVLLSAYILDEKITLKKGIGVVLALLSFFFLFPINSALLHIDIGHLYLIGLIFSLGVSTVFLRLGILKNGLNSTRFYRATVQTIVVFFAVIIVTGLSVKSIPLQIDIIYPALNGILGGCAFILFCRGLETVGASTAKPVVVLATITSVVLGIAVLGESLTVMKLAGICIAIAAVVLLSYEKQ